MGHFGVVKFSINNIKLPFRRQEWAYILSIYLEAGDGPVTLANAATTVTVNSNTLSVEGDIDEANAGSTLTKAGNGTLALNGPIRHTGGTTVSVGTLAIGGESGYGKLLFPHTPTVIMVR